MHIYLLILRILHIGCGVFWSGTILLLSFYIFPASEKLGPDGGKMIQALMSTKKFPIVMTIMGFLSVLSGLGLMWQLSSGFTWSWFSSSYGMALGTGAITGLIAFFQGIFVNRPKAMRMEAIGKEIATKGGPPSEEQKNEIASIRNTLTLSTRLMAIELIISIVAMGGARYF